MYTHATRSEIKIVDWGLTKDIETSHLDGSPEKWFALPQLVDGSTHSLFFQYTCVITRQHVDPSSKSLPTIRFNKLDCRRDDRS